MKVGHARLVERIFRQDALGVGLLTETGSGRGYHGLIAHPPPEP